MISMKNISKQYKAFLSLCLLFLSNFVFADGTGPGVPFEEPPTSPIDMYVIYLAAIAIVFIIFSAKRIIKKLA